jgi:hypothetical protein
MPIGRPPKEDREEDAAAALEEWLAKVMHPKDVTPEQRARIREALGDSEYAVEEGA